MCGILCFVSSLDSVPGRFASGADWTASTKDEVDEFIGSMVPVMSDTDRQKIAHQETLRGLYDEISCLKANVKLAESKRCALVSSKEKEIESMISHSNQVPLSPAPPDSPFDEMAIQVARRGPDHLAYRHFITGKSHLHTFSSVLLLRQPFTKQPVTSSRFVLQFNGELYNRACLEGGNDTVMILDILAQQLAAHDTVHKAVWAMATLLDGEFAFVLSDLELGCTYFARDPIGRRSLVYCHDKENLYILSVCPANRGTMDFIECPPSVFRYHHASKALDSIGYDPLPTVAASLTSAMDDLNRYVVNTHAILGNAVKVRQQCIAPLHDRADHSLAVMFSGGLDCTLIAALVCENAFKAGTPLTLDLLTVGFDNARTGKQAWESPDRQLAKKSWFHLCQKYQNSKIHIRLVEFNVAYDAWLTHRAYVRRLMFPCATEMDLSIAIAFYFASQRGIGQCTEFQGPIPATFPEFVAQERPNVSIIAQYSLECKVLLSGLGADELFAGYTRHEAQFAGLERQSDAATIEQCYSRLQIGLQDDLARIHHRNLGRDDRVIATWGKEVRYPFLDMGFVSHACNVPANLKFRYDFRIISNKRGERQVIQPIRKFLLRELAAYMGLHWVQHEPKRAIQFGAKLAKMELGLGLSQGHDTLL